jgi:hypothetical protein
MEDLLKVLLPLATLAVALLGFAVAWGQWTTTRSKLILDLFERRREVYSDLLGPIADAVRTTRPEAKTLGEFVRILDRAQFLFGRDVLDYIDKYRHVLHRMVFAAAMLASEHMSDENRKKYFRMQQDALTEFNGFYTNLAKLMIPYMLMDQKRPWTLSRIPRWFGWRWRQVKQAVGMRWHQWRKKRAATAAP